MPETIEVENGRITWGEGTIDELSFSVEIQDDASITISFEKLVFDTPESKVEGMRVYQILQEIQLTNSRAVPRFHLCGRTVSGIDVETSYAYPVNGTKYKVGSPMEITLVAKTDELLFTYPDTSEDTEPIEMSVEYLTQGQLGGVVPDSVELPVGTLSYKATPKMAEASKGYGKICIEKTVARADLDQWIKECDEAAERALHLLSIAQGRWYNWSLRRIYKLTEEYKYQLFRCFRPRERVSGSRIHLFFHLDLDPVLTLLKDRYSRQFVNDTGIDTALLLMLRSTPYTEGRLWDQIIGLAHLLERYDDRFEVVKKLRIMDGNVFRKKIKPILLSALEHAVDEGVIEADSDEYQTFKAKLSGLNQPVHYTLFQSFIDHYGVPIGDLDPEDVKDVVVHCRNDLAHQGITIKIGGDDDDRLRFLADLAEEILNRVVMTLLGYEGNYVSALHLLEHWHFSKDGVRPLNRRPAGNS